jgi:hypothetical protein
MRMRVDGKLTKVCVNESQYMIGAFRGRREGTLVSLAKLAPFAGSGFCRCVVLEDRNTLQVFVGMM